MQNGTGVCEIGSGLTSPAAGSSGEAPHGKRPKIENARDRSLWRFNLDHSVVQPVLRPPAPPAVNPAFAGVVSSGCAGTRPPTCVDGLHSSSTGGQLSGSDRSRVFGSTCSPHRCASVFRVTCRPAAIHRACAHDPGSIQLAPNGPSPGKADDLPPIRIGRRPLARLAAASGLRRLLPQLPRLASASGLLRLLSPSGFTGRQPLGLRLAVSSPAEPLMHSLFPPNLASPAEPSMSIPFPPALASSGIVQFNNFRLAPSFVTSGASSDPSQACARGFTLCPG